MFGLGTIHGKEQTVSYFKCIDLETGERFWLERLSAWGAMSLAGDKLIIIEGNGRLVIANATSKGYQEISSLEVVKYDIKDVRNAKTSFWTQPIFSHGHIYIRSCNGDVACVNMQ